LKNVRCEEHAGAPQAVAAACNACLVSSLEAARRADDEEAASGAVDWAEAAPVTVERLPDDLRRRAEAHYAANGHERVPGGNGLEAYVRHHWTNYDALLATLEERFPAAARGGLAYGALRDRVDEAVHEALDELQERCVDDDR
jgi:hypothetical protein